MKRVILTILFSVISLHAISCNNNDKNISIFFGNGMFTDRDVADSGLAKLQIKLKDSLSSQTVDYQKVDYAVSYNQNEFWALQLLEVAVQQNIDNWSSFWNFLAGVEIAPDWFQEAMGDVATSFDRFSYVVDGDLQNHVQKYRAEISEGKKVLVVSHSQGNFYSNRAYGNVNSNSFGIVSVATPANQVAGGGSYMTLTNDLVMHSVRIIDPLTLPANFTNTNDSGDWTGHGFIESYLNGDITGPKLVEYVLATLDRLPLPPKTSQDGIITVTLEWGAEPDVDLHVFEPNGTHVFYANKNGPSGYLDVDDVSSYGPEHYYVGCATLEEGTYKIGVNYYYGRAPETAKVQISSGDVVRDYSTTLSQSVGGSGNNSPISVASIEVSKNQDGEYEFSISGQ